MRPRGTAKSRWDGREEECRYPYLNPEGELLFEKVRYQLDPAKWNGQVKDFGYSMPVRVCRKYNNGLKCGWERNWEIDNWRSWSLPFHPHMPPDAHRWIYPLPAALEAISEGDTIHWVEGEKDADAIWKVGGAAVTVHQGACKATPEQARWLLGARRIWIWADKDWWASSAGPAHPEVGAYDAALRFNRLVRLGYPASRIRIVRARGSLTGKLRLKDAADHLEHYPLSKAVTVDREALAEIARRYVPAPYGHGKASAW